MWALGIEIKSENSMGIIYTGNPHRRLVGNWDFLWQKILPGCTIASFVLQNDKLVLINLKGEE